ncbi:methyltransferase domain-containing protein [Streptosporangium saharense]|uniref:Protein-L-isoaspartate O-methyltransferase n=1 Tax=Streptosporangium saharense TaxID=1706840 RepID=A0A7W7VJY1_9ACTN|nr:methyltransferase domain-containing protein [Streptosporangium saharense]MBB4912988.1 protein-L-isoaspartate O-methyltransferase [Streptosporangium saharense]
MTAEEPQQGLREILLACGVSPEWMKAFEAAPRELFLPEVMWPFDNGRDLVVSRPREPERWRRWADTDVPITTQWNDGRHTGTAPGEERTSSSSAPSLVFTMFADLSVDEGMRVLEVGTGTGWCAALLSARLGESNVVSVEVDEAVAVRAREALSAAGWHPEVVVGDGLLGWPRRAPYDRVLVTAAVREVPRAWIEQTRPGGVIVVPWGTRHSYQDAIARLVVGEDGTASGHFTRLARFMQIRSHRLEVRSADYIPGNAWPDDTRASATGLTASKIVGDPTTTFVLSLLLPDCVRVPGRNADGTRGMWLYGLGDRSWAAVFFGEDSRVFQGGPRNLWDEVEAAHRWWSEQGQPGYEKFGLTITGDARQETWLGDPSTPVPNTASAVQ